MTGKISAPAPARHSRHTRPWLALPALVAFAALATPAQACSSSAGLNAYRDYYATGWKGYYDGALQPDEALLAIRAARGFSGEFPAFVTAPWDGLRRPIQGGDTEPEPGAAAKAPDAEPPGE